MKLSESDGTERVPASKLRPGDWVVMFRWPAGAKSEEMWAWHLTNAEIDGSKVWLESPMQTEEGWRTRRVWVGADTMFVRRRVDRTINMRPDLASAR